MDKIKRSVIAGDVGDFPIYSFNLNGSGKKKIASGMFLKVQNSKIYYCKYMRRDDVDKFKVYSCSPDGKNNKALTGWVSSISEKYYQ